MKILHISDTHGCHRRMRDLPDADVIVHSGDFTMGGSEREAVDFMNWFCDLTYRHKIFISGNHDECMYGADISGLDANVHYLCNAGVVIEGTRFYGVPMFMRDCCGNRQRANYDRIPDDTDVLITHAPAYGILDFDDGINYGSKDLLEKLSSLELQAHLFGHIHARHGLITIGGTQFSNGAIMSANYDALNPPILLTL